MSGFLVNKSLLDPTVTQYAGGTATFTLPQSGSTNATEVYVGGVPQIAGVDFNVTGTTLTLTTSAPAGANFVCARQYFSDGITGTPGANTVATAAIQNDAVNTAKILNDSVTGSKLNPALVAGDIIYADGTDTINRLAKGAALQTLQMNAGATAPNWVTAAGGGFTLATEQATTSGTVFTFGSIPAGTTMIVIMFEGVSQSSTGEYHVTIGDSGGLETSGYIASGGEIGAGVPGVAITASFIVGRFSVAAGLYSGNILLALKDSANFTWVCHGLLVPSAGQNVGIFGGGAKSLTAELTQLSIFGGTFDAGSINIMYQ